jgi:hypothetical protein
VHAGDVSQAATLSGFGMLVGFWHAFQKPGSQLLLPRVLHIAPRLTALASTYWHQESSSSSSCLRRPTTSAPPKPLHPSSERLHSPGSPSTSASKPAVVRQMQRLNLQCCSWGQLAAMSCNI